MLLLIIIIIGRWANFNRFFTQNEQFQKIVFSIRGPHSALFGQNMAHFVPFGVRNEMSSCLPKKDQMRPPDRKNNFLRFFVLREKSVLVGPPPYGIKSCHSTKLKLIAVFIFLDFLPSLRNHLHQLPNHSNYPLAQKSKRRPRL